MYYLNLVYVIMFARVLYSNFPNWSTLYDFVTRLLAAWSAENVICFLSNYSTKPVKMSFLSSSSKFARILCYIRSHLGYFSDHLPCCCLIPAFFDNLKVILQMRVLSSVGIIIRHGFLGAWSSGKNVNPLETWLILGYPWTRSEWTLRAHHQPWWGNTRGQLLQEVV